MKGIGSISIVVVDSVNFWNSKYIYIKFFVDVLKIVFLEKYIVCIKII